MRENRCFTHHASFHSNFGRERPFCQPSFSLDTRQRHAAQSGKLSWEKIMAWIKIIQEHEATGRLKEAYAKLIEPWGGVDNILKIHSLNVRSLWAHFELYKTVMYGRSGLSRAQREMIAVVVSAANRCHY